MPNFIEALLLSRWFVVFARIVLTIVFWTAGIAGIADFPGKVAEMRAHGLEPAELVAVAVTTLQLGAPILIILNRWAWLAAGALGVFLVLTIPIAHAFWRVPEAQKMPELFIVLEHISIIGGLMVVASLGVRTRQHPTSLPAGWSASPADPAVRGNGSSYV